MRTTIADLIDSRPLTGARVVAASLGGGTQSTAMLLMAAQGLIKPMPDFAIFADTGCEPQAVYDNIQWLAQQLPFSIQIVRRGSTSLMEDTYVPIPLHLHHTRAGKTGMLRTRECTDKYKIRPIQCELRARAGLEPRQRCKKPVVELWIGLSYDELSRVKIPKVRFIKNRWPLIELEMRRQDVIDWFHQHYPEQILPRSSCLMCPYHSNAEWQHIRDHDPEGWAAALRYDAQLREGEHAKGLLGTPYLHPSCRPLDQVKFSKQPMPDMFDDECDGVCGL